MRILTSITQGRTITTLGAQSARVHRVGYPAGQRMPLHAHRTANVTVVIAGELRDVQAGCERVCGAMSMLIKPSGSAHESSCGPNGAQTVVVEVDRGAESMLRRSCGLFEEPACFGWCDGGDAMRQLMGLWSEVRRACRENDGRVSVEPWLERLGDLMHKRRHGSMSPQGGARMDCIAGAARILEADGSRGGIGRAAAVVGVHPVSLTRLFRRELGCTPGEYRRRARVRCAAEQLATSRRPIASIALDAGFSDQAHLTRELRREAGVTPRALRLLACGA